MVITNGFDMVELIPITPPGRGQRLHLLGESTLTGGAGGWDSVDRPRKVAATEWTSIPPWQLVLPLRLDHTDERDGTDEGSVEAVIQRLEQWILPQEVTGFPQVFLLDGPLKVPASNPPWVITDLSWGTEIRRADRHRIAQEVSITFLQHTAATIQLGPAARARAGT